MNTQQESDLFGRTGGTPNQQANTNQVKINYNPLPRPVVSDTSSAQPADTSPTVSDDVGQRPIQEAEMADTVRQIYPTEEKDVGHDPDLPPRSDRHTLTTYEAGKIFEEAECRVSERTIIRWCNKNKSGKRRLECAFDPNDRKYYIVENSVKDVIREERSKGRQSEMYAPNLSDIEDEVTDKHSRHTQESVGQRPTAPDENVGRWEKVTDTQKTEVPTQPYAEEPKQARTTEPGLVEENTKLKIELAKLEEQARTKDEMMNFLRKEIDRRGEQNSQDRDTYNKSLDWFRGQVEMKDSVIERLNTEMRGLLEAPKQPIRQNEQQSSETPGGLSN